jgi:hypothetical protein
VVTKEQYNQLQQHKEALLMFRNTGQAVGNVMPLFRIHKEATGRDLSVGCDSCIGEVLIDCLNMLEQYEK